MPSTALMTLDQTLDPGALVHMFEIDLTPIGVTAPPFRLAQDGPFSFGGVPFERFDVKAEGYEYNGQGQLPQPKFRLSNVKNLLSGPLREYQDFIGAKVTRIRTYKQFLDGSPDADPTSAYDPDIYFIEQKLKQHKGVVEWSLAAAMDQQGRMLPGRTVYQDVCQFEYRVWNPATNAFDYSEVTCPYAGNLYFDVHGEPTTAPNDVCSHLLGSGCRKRFTQYGDSPFGAFPGVARTRIS